MRLPLITAGTVALTTLTLAATLAVPAYGGGAPTDARCKQAKLNASAKTTASSLGCYAKAAATGLPVAPNCVGKADAVLATAFAKTDALGGCATTGDAPAVEASINACVNEIAGALGPVVLPNRCLYGKLRAAAKKTSAKLKCAATAAAKSVSPDAKCLTKAETAFASTWSSLEARGGCPTAGDANAIETIVDDDCVLAVEGTLGLSTSSTPTTFQCCSLVDPNTGAPLLCFEVPPALCAQVPGAIVGAPGTVCDQAGGCVSTPPNPGACCQFVQGADICATGPPDIIGASGSMAHLQCVSSDTNTSATFYPDALCTPSGACVPTTRATTPTTTTTTTSTTTTSTTPTTSTTTTTTSTTTTTTINVSFTTPGTYQWIVPPGVSEVSVVVVGAGGGGGGLYGQLGAGGGGGGALCYANAIAVTPGTSIPVVVGAGGAGASFDDPGQVGNCCVVCDAFGCYPGCGCSNHYGSDGGDSSFGGTLVAHGGGGFQGYWNQQGAPPGLRSGDAPGGSGGGVGTCFSGGGGSFDFAAGGAAGYAGNGGNGCSSPSTGCPGSAGSGGGGGGGVAAGGGVGLRGIADSGPAGNLNHLDGYPGSQIDASDPVVGGGGSGYAFTSYGGGDSGGVRILFNGGFTYPTGDRYAGAVPGCGQFPSNILPAGTYRDSCDSCALSACVLSCSCLDSIGFPKPSALDLTGCAFGPDISNENGVLTCTPG